MASTDHCPVSMFTVGDHVLGIGGHPEMPIPFLRALIESRRGTRIPDDIADKGLASLEATPDVPLLRDWMTEFLLGASRRTNDSARKP